MQFENILCTVSSVNTVFVLLYNHDINRLDRALGDKSMNSIHFLLFFFSFDFLKSRGLVKRLGKFLCWCYVMRHNDYGLK